MKKLLRFSFIIIFLLTCMFPLNIFATEPDDELDLDKISFPTSYGAGDLAVSIDGVDINIYAIPAKNALQRLEDGKNTKDLTESEKQEMYNLIKPLIQNNPTKVVHLTDDDIVLTDVKYTESSNKKLGLLQLSLFGLDSIAKYSDDILNKDFYEYRDYIRNLNGNEPDPSVEEKQMPEYFYITDCIAKISFDKIPNNYQYVYNKDYMKIALNSFYNPSSSFDVPRINLHQTHYFSISEIPGRDAEGNNYYFGNDVGISVVELAQNKLQTSNDMSDKSIFISTVPMSLEEIQDIDLDEAIVMKLGRSLGVTKLNYRYVDPNQPKDLEVPVGNTAATYPLYIYVLSAIGILVGALVIVSTRLQSKQKQVQQ